MMNVRDALAVFRTFGFLGPGPVDDHLQHAEGFAQAIELGAERSGRPIRRCADLGTGGGVPGLVLMERFPNSEWVFLDSSEKRMAVVRELLDELGFENRCTVHVGRAETLARRVELRGSFDLVVARGFSGPAVTAECAAPLLAEGGLLVVSEPPIETERWSISGLAELGLIELTRMEAPFRFFVAQQETRCSDRYPRRTGIPAKRPLF